MNEMARAMIEAKVEYEKGGAITEAIILPMSWLHDFMRAVGNGSIDDNHGSIYKTDDGKYVVWGANILFANGIDQPVAAGYRYKYLEFVEGLADLNEGDEL